MTYKFKHESGDWKAYRKLPDFIEVDFHPQEGEIDQPPYWERMEQAYSRTIEALQRAQKTGKQYVLFTHGWSTSRIGKATSRSQVRKAMQNKEATPFIIRSECIQHDSVFVAAIKPLPDLDA